MLITITGVGELLFPEGIIRPVLSASTMAWCIRYIYRASTTAWRIRYIYRASTMAWCIRYIYRASTMTWCIIYIYRLNLEFQIPKLVLKRRKYHIQCA